MPPKRIRQRGGLSLHKVNLQTGVENVIEYDNNTIQHYLNEDPNNIIFFTIVGGSIKYWQHIKMADNVYVINKETPAIDRNINKDYHTFEIKGLGGSPRLIHRTSLHWIAPQHQPQGVRFFAIKDYANHGGLNKTFSILIPLTMDLQPIPKIGEEKDEIMGTIMYFIKNNIINELAQLLMASNDLINESNIYIQQIPDAYNQTPLTYAVDKGNLDCVKLLLQAGAGVNIRNALGHSPVQIARYRFNNDLAEFLVSVGAEGDPGPQVVMPPEPVQEFGNVEWKFRSRRRKTRKQIR